MEGIKSVPVRSVEQQQLQQLRRIREQWKRTRTQRINGLRGFLRELGFPTAEGAAPAQRRARVLLDDDAVPSALHSGFQAMLDEITTLEQSIKDIEAQLKALTRDNDDVRVLQQVQGIGLLTSTAMVAAVGSPHRFASPTSRIRGIGEG
jgi:transposase